MVPSKLSSLSSLAYPARSLYVSTCLTTVCLWMWGAGRRNRCNSPVPCCCCCPHTQAMYHATGRCIKQRCRWASICRAAAQRQTTAYPKMAGNRETITGKGGACAFGDTSHARGRKQCDRARGRSCILRSCILRPPALCIRARLFFPIKNQADARTPLGNLNPWLQSNDKGRKGRLLFSRTSMLPRF
ncbi:hypothetical protein HD806DRAFT_294489 [Xylariaceae sp. AK1471]|nr:hypothetical protein HD806DRAFT_294489 [Xylariaceae sp. AK1471]